MSTFVGDINFLFMEGGPTVSRPSRNRLGLVVVLNSWNTCIGLERLYTVLPTRTLH